MHGARCMHRRRPQVWRETEEDRCSPRFSFKVRADQVSVEITSNNLAPSSANTAAAAAAAALPFSIRTTATIAAATATAAAAAVVAAAGIAIGRSVPGLDRSVVK